MESIPGIARNWLKFKISFRTWKKSDKKKIKNKHTLTLIFLLDFAQEHLVLLDFHRLILGSDLLQPNGREQCSNF